MVYRLCFMPDRGRNDFVRMVTVIILIQLAFIALSYWSGVRQAYIFDVMHERIDYIIWSVLYAGLACFWSGFVWLIFDSGQAAASLLVAIAILRIPVFNSSLNYHRKPRRSIFYTNPTWSVPKSQNSWLDRLFGNYYKPVFFLSIILFITLQFFMYV